MDCIFRQWLLDFTLAIKVKGILNKFIIHFFVSFFFKQRHFSYTCIWLGVLVFNMVHLLKLSFIGV